MAIPAIRLAKPIKSVAIEAGMRTRAHLQAKPKPATAKAEVM